MLPHRGRRERVLALLLALAVVLTGCGTQRSLIDIQSAAGGAGSRGSSVDGPVGSELDAAVSEPDAAGSELDAAGSEPPGRPEGNSTGPAKDAVTERGDAPGVVGPSAPQAGPDSAQADPKKPASGPPRGAPLRIGVVGTMSGVGGTQQASTAAIQAWARSVNDRGGVNGHPVEVIVVDDGNDPARLRSALQQLVEQRGVIAFVGLLGAFTLTDGAVAYLESKRVPVVGGDRLSELWQNSPMLFPQGSAGAALIWLHMVNTARLAGKGAPVGWVACQEAQVCKDADRLWQGNAEQLGLAVKYRAQVSVAQPSFTSECLRAQQAGVEWFLLATDANSIRRIASSCEQQGYSPRYAVLQTSDEMTQQKALTGGYYGSSTFPWVVGSTPATAEFQQVMARYAPDVKLSAHASSGWTAAKLFEKAAAQVGDKPTSAQILDGLWSIRDDTLGGLTSPVSFVQDKAAPPRYCYFPMEIRGAAWTFTGGTAPICQPPP